MIKKLLLLLIFKSQITFSQQVINGKIDSDGPIDNIFVANTTNKKTAITNVDGLFTIEAQTGDNIIITASFIEPIQIKLNQNSFKQNPLIIYIKTKTKYLDEIEIKNITTKSHGVASNAKTYTPAERKLKTAGKFKWYSPLLIPLGGMSVDGLINTINGKTKRLRKELVIEKKEMLISKLDNMFPNEFYTEEIQIENQYIRGFKIYCIEVEDLVNAINENNTTMASFLLSELAIEYKSEILKEN